jgi:hypothetical protein
MQASRFVCKVTPYGHLKIYLERVGLEWCVVDKPNLFTKVGKALFAGLLIGTGTAPTHIAVGTGTTPADDDDTTLETEKYRVAAVRSQISTVVTNDTAYYQGTINVLAEWYISEAGLLNGASGSSLSHRQVFTPVHVYNGDVLKVYWTQQE